MKSIISILAFATSLSVFACPEVTGIYKCISGVDSYELNISQLKDENKIDVFTIDYQNSQGVFLADGKKRSLEDEFQSIENGIYKLSCIGDKGLKLSLKGTYQGKKGRVESSIKLVENGVMIISTAYVQTLFGEIPFPAPVVNCSKIKDN